MAEVTPIVQLRQMLDTAEKLLPLLKDTPGTAVQLLKQVDQIEGLLSLLRLQGIDVRAEENRTDSLQRLVAAEARRIQRLVEREQVTSQLAESAQWQLVKALVTQQRQQRIRLSVLLGASLLALGLLLLVVLPRIFPTTPTANTTAIEELARSGNWQAAISRAQAEIQLAPDDPRGYLWLGALQTQQGDVLGAEASWQAAQQRSSEPRAFLLERGLTLSTLGLLDQASADARQLLADPTSQIEGWYLTGQIAEFRGDLRAAIDAFNQAADLADAANNPQLAVVARTRVAFLMQRVLPSLPSPTP